VSAEKRKTRVGVVFGGRSSEHQISCVSAATVMAALDPERYDVVPIGIARTGQWLLASTNGAVPTDAEPAGVGSADGGLPEVRGGTAVVLRADPSAHSLSIVEPHEGAPALANVDVVFPVLHGAYGEDGTIQGLLEITGIPYVGAGVLGSAVALDKEYMKKLLAAEGLPVGEYAVVRRGGDLAEEDRKRLGLPAFVKPATGGSSIGITRIDDWSQLPEALATARAVDAKVLVEAAIDGREIECGVLEGLDGSGPEVSLPAEIRLRSAGEWYDFESKYLDDASELVVPAELATGVAERLHELAGRAFLALDGAGLARVDFFVGDDGAITLNEVNTIPGFTPISLFAKAWAASGIPFPVLVDRLVTTALRRYDAPATD
jgi:D-alanine-D-alanine ligase